LAYCELCGAYIEDFQDSCGLCSDRAGSPVHDGSPLPDPSLTGWMEECPRYSASNGRRLKDPDLALLSSFFLPGLGQFYDGRRGRGGSVLLAFIALAATGLVAFANWSAVGMELTIALLVITSVFWLGQVIDAVRGAQEMNAAISRIPVHEVGRSDVVSTDK
jgi:hypothetical protein